MTWFKTDSGFATHRKIRQLAKGLDVSILEARGIVIGLFCRVSVEAPDGSLDGWDQDDIADACTWHVDPASLQAELYRVRIIVNDDGDGPKINDWMEYAEGYKAAQRARKSRDNKKKKGRKRRTHACGTRATRSRIESVETDRQTDRHGDTDGDIYTKPKNGSRTVSKDVARIVGAYRASYPTRGKHLRPGHKDWKLIADRLRDGNSVEDLFLAIRGNALDPWHKERDAHTIQMIFRNSSKVEQFIQLARRGGPKLKGWLGAHQEMSETWANDEQNAVFDDYGPPENLLPEQNPTGPMEDDPS